MLPMISITTGCGQPSKSLKLGAFACGGRTGQAVVREPRALPLAGSGTNMTVSNLTVDLVVLVTVSIMSGLPSICSSLKLTFVPGDGGGGSATGATGSLTDDRTGCSSFASSPG